MNKIELKQEDKVYDSYTDVLGKKINMKVNKYYNRYYINENDIYITDYVDIYGEFQYRKVEVKNKGKRLLGEVYLGSKVEYN